MGTLTGPLVPPAGLGNKACVIAAAPRLLGTVLRAPLDYALPARCPGCGTLVGSAQAFCLPCWTELDPAGAIPDLPNPAEVDRVHAATRYDTVARAVVLAFKHGNRPRLARPMARLMLRALDPAVVLHDAVLVPVPLHRTRLWRRRYNQAALLSGELATLSGRAHCVDALRRTRATQPQTHGRRGQAEAVAGAFTVPAYRRSVVAGAHILLVDDVVTSGATASHCALALRRAGARSVQLVCWARVVPGRGD